MVVEPARPDADQCHAQSREPRNEELSRGREALSPPDVEQPASHLNGSNPAAHIPVDSILDDRRNGWGCTRNRLGAGANESRLVKPSTVVGVASAGKIHAAQPSEHETEMPKV